MAPELGWAYGRNTWPGALGKVERERGDRLDDLTGIREVLALVAAAFEPIDLYTSLRIEMGC